ncbi:MAG: hypothetical protein AAFY76_11085 [Cyanobacteria bacterium J06649_11]
MSYILEIQFADTIDELNKERIKKYLNGGTLRIDFAPKIGLPVELPDGSDVIIRSVKVLAKTQENVSARVIITT